MPRASIFVTSPLALRELEAAILRQDTALDATAPPPVAPPPPAPPPAAPAGMGPMWWLLIAVIVAIVLFMVMRGKKKA